MGDVREENERLKTMLERVEKDYKSLQLRFFDIVQQQEPAKKPVAEHDSSSSFDESIVEPELVSLSLGRRSCSGCASSEAKKEEKTSKSTREEEELKGSLSLALDSNSSEEQKDEAEKEATAGEGWPPSKMLKTVRNGSDDEASQQNPVKRARVSVRARCDTPTVSFNYDFQKIISDDESNSEFNLKA